MNLAWRGIFVFVVLVLSACAHSPALLEKAEPPILNEPPRPIAAQLNLSMNELRSYETGSDAGGCTWSKIEDGKAVVPTPEQKKQLQVVAQLLTLPVWAMPNSAAPKECESDYNPVENLFIFSSGILAIPSTHLYPPPPEGEKAEYYTVEFGQSRNDENMREFCLKRADLLKALKPYKKDPAIYDCEF